MAIWKKIGKMLLGMLLGAAVGYGGVMLVLWLVDGGNPVAGTHKEGMDYGLLALSIGLAVIWLVVNVVIHLVAHEAGHLIMGLLTGYRFLSFRIFKFTLVKTDEGLRWKRFHISGTGGQCLLELPEDQDVKNAPWFWYNAGGVLMNLLLAVVAVIVLRTMELHIVGYSFFIMLAFVGFVMALTNGVPMIMNGVSNDGHNIYILWRHPEHRRFFVRMLQMAGQLNKGRRLKELPEMWFEDVPVNNQSSYMEISNRLNYMSLLEDQGQLEKALSVSEEIMSLGKKLPQLFQLEVGGERVMLELLTKNRLQVVDELWTKPLERYVVMNSKYSPIKCAVLYAYELLHNNNSEKAETHKQYLLLHQNDFTMLGEARTAIDFVEKAEQAMAGGPHAAHDDHHYENLHE